MLGGYQEGAEVGVGYRRPGHPHLGVTVHARCYDADSDWPYWYVGARGSWYSESSRFGHRLRHHGLTIVLLSFISVSIFLLSILTLVFVGYY